MVEGGSSEGMSLTHYESSSSRREPGGDEKKKKLKTYSGDFAVNVIA